MSKRRARGDTEGSGSPIRKSSPVAQGWGDVGRGGWDRTLWERGYDHSEACKACEASELLFWVGGGWQQSAWREQDSRTMGVGGIVP